MMKAVYRYPLDKEKNITTLIMLEGAEVINIDYQPARREVSLWALVDATLHPDQTDVRSFLIIGTGDPIEHPIKGHVGSFMMPDGFHTFHVFELAVG